MKKVKKILLILFLIGIMILFAQNTYASDTFKEYSYNIDNHKYHVHLTSNYIPKLALGCNSIFVPYIGVLVFIIVQIILLIKYSKGRLFNSLLLCACLSIITCLLICIDNIIIGNIINNGISTSSMYRLSNALWMEIVNIIINTILLILGLVVSKKVLKTILEKNSNSYDKKVILIIILIIIVLLGVKAVLKMGPEMHVVEEEWAFGTTFETKQYNCKVKIGEKIGNTQFLVKEIDDEGVLIEYESGYYEKSEDNSESHPHYDYEHKFKTIQQKMKWNVNYRYIEESYPMLAADGGINYFVRFEK